MIFFLGVARIRERCESGAAVGGGANRHSIPKFGPGVLDNTGPSGALGQAPPIRIRRRNGRPVYLGSLFIAEHSAQRW